MPFGPARHVMVFRLLVACIAALIVLPLGWRLLQSAADAGWTTPRPAPKPFTFDNGSVRAPSGPASAVELAARHGLKKCRRGEQVLYTDGPCPAGSQAADVGGTVSVVKSNPAPAAPHATGAGTPSSTGEGPRRLPPLREVLDVSGGPSLREQHTQRVLERQR